eukprot:5178444-Pyramimonas_sp.AAC.1
MFDNIPTRSPLLWRKRGRPASARWAATLFGPVATLEPGRKSRRKEGGEGCGRLRERERGASKRRDAEGGPGMREGRMREREREGGAGQDKEDQAKEAHAMPHAFS